MYEGSQLNNSLNALNETISVNTCVCGITRSVFARRRWEDDGFGARPNHVIAKDVKGVPTAAMSDARY